MHVECNATSPNQDCSQELQSPHKDGPNVFRIRIAYPVHPPFEGRGRTVDRAEGRRSARSWQKTALEEMVDEVSRRILLLSTRLSLAAYLPLLSGFCERLYLEAPGLRRGRRFGQRNQIFTGLLQE